MPDPNRPDVPLPTPGDAPITERVRAAGVVVVCADEIEQAALLERLTREGYQVRALM